MAQQSPPTVQTLFTALSKDVIRTMLVALLVSVGIRADLWVAGGVASTILTYSAQMMAMLSTQIANLILGFFLSTSTGTALRLLASNMYGVTVPTATFASGPVTFVNTSGNSYGPLAANTLIILNPTTNIQYTNPDPVTIGPNATVVVLNMTASTQGSAGNSSPGAITQMVSVFLGVTCTNSIAIVGLDAPPDAAVRSLCFNSLGIRSVRGPRTAYAYAVQIATNSVTGRPVNINRWGVPESSHTGIVNVTVAGPGGTTDPDDVLGAIASIEQNARPNGIMVNVSAASVAIYAPSITVYARAPSQGTPSTAVDAIQTALDAFLEIFPIGGEAAADESFPAGTTGIFASGVDAIIGEALVGIGWRLVSTVGVEDQFMSSTQVLANGITSITVRIVPSTSGNT